MSFTYEQLQAHFPVYLSESSKRKLAHDLSQFNLSEKPKKFYEFKKIPDELRQGDIFHDVESLIYPQKIFKNISAVLLSNSCLADLENKRDIGVYLTFAPLLDFANLETMFKKHEQESKIQEFIESKQNNIIYFPPTQSYEKGVVALLDRAFSLPLTDILTKKLISNRESSLSMLGWYFFLFNLSYFYCRMGEEIQRS